MKYITLQTTVKSVPLIHHLLEKFSKRTKVIRQYQYYYIIDYILRNSDKNNNNVPMNRNNLAEVLGVGKMLCSEMIKDLVDYSIIDLNRFHFDGKSACFGVSYSCDNLLSISIPQSKFKPLHEIIKRRNSLRDGFINTPDGKLYLNYISNISITNTEYIITDLYNKYVLLPNGVNKYKMKVFKREKSNLERIADADFFVKRPDEKSRVYCNLSILHREYRKYLRFDGNTLKGIDVRSSQPMLAGMLIKSKSSVKNKELQLELSKYLKSCEDGLFYELFMEGDDFLEENRKSFKQEFFKKIFFSRVSVRMNKMKKRFITLFPLIYEIICEMKGGLKENKKDRSFAQFAIELQRFEASIIFDKINLPMLKEGYGCYNVYDSIVSHDVGTLTEATNRLYKEFAKYGVKPMINIESYE